MRKKRRTRAAVQTADNDALGARALPGRHTLGAPNASALAAARRYIARAHDATPCTAATPVHYAPVSPNGIGNKVMALVAAFNVALHDGRRLVVTDWPPLTMPVSYALADVLRVSSCQEVFERARAREGAPPVEKCTEVRCPHYTRCSFFSDARTQPHWATGRLRQLLVPAEFAQHIEWAEWWRLLTSHLFRPSARLAAGLSRALQHTSLGRSPPATIAAPPPVPVAEVLLLRGGGGGPAASPTAETFAALVARDVAAWGRVRRPLIGLHYRTGDSCADTKRGGCKYIRGWDDVTRRLREAGYSSGTIFLATDDAKMAQRAIKQPTRGFDVLQLLFDRHDLQRSHSRGDGRREGDELFHLQLLDLALLSQVDVLVGAFASTFVKAAFQLGSTPTYVTTDTFPWCPLLRCYWGWRDLCHNCGVCADSMAHEACRQGQGSLGSARQLHSLAACPAFLSEQACAGRAPLRRYVSEVLRWSRCPALADHPLPRSMHAAPVDGLAFAVRVDGADRPPLREVCSGADGASTPPSASCECGFRRFDGVDNAASGMSRPSWGFGTARVLFGEQQEEGARVASAVAAPAYRRPGPPSLSACEQACCEEPTCHSVVYASHSSSCYLSLAIAHGARPRDWCWRPVLRNGTVTSVRLPGRWEGRAVRAAAEVMRADRLIAPEQPHVYAKVKAWTDPPGLSHPLERSIEPEACEERSAEQARSARRLNVSRAVLAALPQGDPRPPPKGTPPPRCDCREGGSGGCQRQGAAAATRATRPGFLSKRLKPWKKRRADLQRAQKG